MARFEQGHVKLTSGKIVYLAANEIGHDGTDFTFSTTISGVDPTQNYHLTTKLYVDTNTIGSLVDDTSPQLGGDLDTNGHDILFGSDTISGTGTMITGDHGAATNPEVVNTLYGTGAPPTASTTTIGSLYIKYTV